MCSWKFEQPSPVLQTESQKLLLRLLSHPLLQVRVETYRCTLSLVKVSAGHPPCTVFNKSVLFMAGIITIKAIKRVFWVIYDTMNMTNYRF